MKCEVQVNVPNAKLLDKLIDNYLNARKTPFVSLNENRKNSLTCIKTIG
jgi:hypothetical protein